MPLILLALFQNQQIETTFNEPAYFLPLVVALLVLGAILWLVAAVLGFARASAFGAHVRWFSFASVCLILFHVQFLALAFGLILKDVQLSLTILSFFNVFVVVGAFCAIMGFIRLTHPR